MSIKTNLDKSKPNDLCPNTKMKAPISIPLDTIKYRSAKEYHNESPITPSIKESLMCKTSLSISLTF